MVTNFDIPRRSSKCLDSKQLNLNVPILERVNIKWKERVIEYYL